MAKQLKEDVPQDNQSRGGIPILGAGISQSGIGAHLINMQAGASAPPLAPHNPVLLMTGSPTL